MVTGVNAFGFFVSLDEVFAEGLVRLVDLPNDYYRYDEVRMRLAGRKTGASFALGDRVRVRVAHVDLRRRHVNLVLAGEVAGEVAGEPEEPGEEGKGGGSGAA
jgi:ribonuclease R